MNQNAAADQLQGVLAQLVNFLQQHREISLLACAVATLFSLVQIFKGWRLHQLAEQLFGALLGMVFGAVAAAAVRGLAFKTSFALDTPLIATAIPCCLIGLVIGFKLARFDVTTLARTGLTIEGDGMHTVYGIIWGHALTGALILATAIFCAAAALAIIPAHREHFALLAAAVIALILGIKGASGQTRSFLTLGP